MIAFLWRVRAETSHSREVEAVQAQLDAALVTAAEGNRGHRRLLPVQPVAELMTLPEYAAWREHHVAELPGVSIPEPKSGRMALVLFHLRPSVTASWLRGASESLITAPHFVWPPAAENAETALAAGIAAWLGYQEESYAPSPPLLRRDATGAFEVVDLGQTWPGRLSRAAGTPLAERPGRKRPRTRRITPRRSQLRR